MLASASSSAGHNGPSRLSWPLRGRCTLRTLCLQELPRETEGPGKGCFPAGWLPGGGSYSGWLPSEWLGITGLQGSLRKEKALPLRIECFPSRNSAYYRDFLATGRKRDCWDTHNFCDFFSSSATACKSPFKGHILRFSSSICFYPFNLPNNSLR